MTSTFVQPCTDGKTYATVDYPTPPDTLPSPPPGASVVETMRDISWGDSLVWPPGSAQEIPNITNPSPRMFVFTLRHRGAWYDGDRDLKNNRKGLDKSRAEIYALRKLGTDKPFTLGSTWLLGFTVRLAPDFVPSRGYSNLSQPVNHQSFLNMVKLKGDTVTAQLSVFKDGVKTPISIARTVEFKRGEWTTFVVKMTFAKDGYYGLSVNGDEFKGIKIDTTKGGDRKPPFGLNVGLYGSATTGVDGKPLGDQVAEYYNIFAKRVS